MPAVSLLPAVASELTQGCTCTVSVLEVAKACTKTRQRDGLVLSD